MLESFSVLYVEDNKRGAEEIAFFLEPRVKKLYTAADGEEGLALFEAHHSDMVITDIQMPKINGIGMTRRIKALGAQAPVITTTVFNEAEYLLEAIDPGVEKYLIKPLNFKDLFKKLRGVESSNFSRLFDIDFDYIKLDGRFVTKLLESEKDRMIMRAIVILARSLKIRTVAEFVGKQALYEQVQQCRVDFAQGYYFGRPKAYLIEPGRLYDGAEGA